MSTRTTVSTCTADTDEAKHVFEIFDYSQHRGMGHQMLLRSSTFSVGGHDWSIRFYPDGLNSDCGDCISVFVELLGKAATVSASCDIRLVDQTTGKSFSMHKTRFRKFSTSDDSSFTPKSGMFKSRSTFESSLYLRDDHLTIQCVISARKAPRVSATEFLERLEAPPSNITEQLGELLDEEMGADVTFSVEGETFTAHRILLAARSPVFRAELYGPMKESKAQNVTIEDMEPDVFRALLRFIYTDSLEDVGQNTGEPNSEFICHLLVAADRYAVDRLKLLCECILSKYLDVETVSTTLAVAHHHSWGRLKETCLEFISSSSVMDAVMATEGYKNLKSTCPYALIDMLEKTRRFHKT